MKRLLFLPLLFLSMTLFGATPSFQSFNTSQFDTNNFIITIDPAVSNRFNIFNPFDRPTYIVSQGASIAAGIWTNNNGTFGLVNGSTTNTYTALLSRTVFTNNPFLISSSVPDASGGETLDLNIFYLTNTFIPFYGSYPANGTNIILILFNDNDIANGSGGYVGPAVMISRLTNWNALAQAAGFKTMVCTIEDNNGATNLALYANDRNLVNSFIRTNLSAVATWICDFDQDDTMVTTNNTADNGIAHWNASRHARAAYQIARTLFQVPHTAPAMSNPDFQARRLFILPGGAIVSKSRSGGQTNPPSEVILWDGVNGNLQTNRYAIQIADQPVGGTTLTASSNLVVTLPTAGVWFVKCFAETDSTVDCKAQLAFVPNATWTGAFTHGSSIAGTTWLGVQIQDAGFPSSVANTATGVEANEFAGWEFNLTVITTASTTVTFKFSPSSAGTSTLKINSTIFALRVN